VNQNVPVDSFSWDMSEQLIALGACKNAMTSYTDDLFLGAQEAHQALWLGQRTPTDPLDLGNDLQLSKVRLREWRDSGARVGADEALTYTTRKTLIHGPIICGALSFGAPRISIHGAPHIGAPQISSYPWRTVKEMRHG
jgi:hypothetical protein